MQRRESAKFRIPLKTVTEFLPANHANGRESEHEGWLNFAS